MITTKEELSKKINSYNPNVVRFIFPLVSKKKYVNSVPEYKETILDVDNEKSVIIRNVEIITVIIFPNSSFENIIHTIDILDDYIKKIRNNNEHFLFLKENFSNFEKKEKRLLTIVKSLSTDD